MARVKETKANVLHLPDTSYIDDLEIRKAIDALSHVVREIWEADHTEEFFQLINSRRFEKTFFNIISSYVKKYFSEEEVVKNIDFEDPTLRFVFKKHLLLSTGIPGNRELEVELPQPVEDSIPQAFDIVVTGDNTISVQGGSFVIDNVLKTLATTPLTISSTGEVYITATVDITPSVAVGTVPEFSQTTAYEPLGKVYFSDGKITNVEPYNTRGWFHCHTWGDCEASSSTSSSTT